MPRTSLVPILLIASNPVEVYHISLEKQATRASKEERIKGYKVKVQYQPVTKAEKKSKREALAKVILKGLRHQKDKR